MLGVGKLNWPGIGHFQTESCKVFFSGNNGLRRNNGTRIVSKTYSSCSARCGQIIHQPDFMESLHVYATNAEEQDYAGVQKESVHASEQDVLIVWIVRMERQEISRTKHDCGI